MMAASASSTTDTVALIGAGPAAVDALWRLRSAGANVRWFSDLVDVAEEALRASAPPGTLELTFADPLQTDLRKFTAVVSAADSALDEKIAAQARAAGVPVKVLSQPALSTLHATLNELTHRLAGPQAALVVARGARHGYGDRT